MRRTLVLGSVLSLVALLASAGVAGAGHRTVGEVTTLRTYDPDAGELPEGLTIDRRGRVYLTMTFLGEVRRVDPDGSEVVVAQLPAVNGFGPLGIVADQDGDLYVGVVAFDPALQGVYHVARDGSIARLAGSEQIGFANGLAFGDRGVLYITDSVAGRVWRSVRGGPVELWLESPLLLGDGSGPLPFPLGANGITYRQRTLYVTNTEIGSVIAIPVRPDGEAGSPVVLAHDARLGGADGITVDVRGNLYVAVIAQSTILRLSPAGEVIEVLADASDGLDSASSLAFGTGRGDRTSLFVANFSVAPFFGGVRTAPPALLTLETGEVGRPH
ncbi:MAG TPA: SMP-30/gluconolactonase/LRE family protein [Acidimicrobiales bacterium]|nr:SMP-30/gluconolactonase/LRE family protein [Acidimicrobiales bacterium]